MERNYVYAVYAWCLKESNKLPHYKLVSSHPTSNPKVWQYTYRLTVPMSDCHFDGIGDGRVEARQKAAECAYRTLGIDPAYLDAVMSLNDNPETVFESAKEILPQLIITKIEKSSSIHYIYGLDAVQGRGSSYIYDNELGDIRPNDEKLIGDPKIMYVDGIADHVIEQYGRFRDRLPEIYVHTYEATKDARRMIEPDDVKDAAKKNKYLWKYIDDMEGVTKKLGDEIMLFCKGTTCGSRNRVIKDYLWANGYAGCKDERAIRYEKIAICWDRGKQK